MSTDKTAASPRLMKFTLLASACLALLGGGFFFLAASQKPLQPKAQAHKISVSKSTCEPAQLTVPAGQNHFEITNNSDRPVEWEILDGVMVIEERENIAPGYNVSFTTTLKPGDYAITCGLLTNPRGTLTVLPSSTSTPKAKLPPTAFLGPLAEYKLRLMRGAATLVKQATTLEQAIIANDLPHSQQAYLALRLSYKKFESAMSSFAAHEVQIDPQAVYLEKREQDAAFTGFHALEYGLYAKQSTAGLTPLSAQLVNTLKDLETRITATPFKSGDILHHAAKQASLLAGNLEQGESPYAQFDSWELSAAVVALHSNSQLLQPVLQEADAPLAQKINADFVSLSQQLSPFAHTPASQGMAPTFSKTEKTEIYNQLMMLSGDLDQANILLGAE